MENQSLVEEEGLARKGDSRAAALSSTRLSLHVQKRPTQRSPRGFTARAGGADRLWTGDTQSTSNTNDLTAAIGH